MKKQSTKPVPSKRLVDMDELEMKRTFRNIGERLTRGLLEDARGPVGIEGIGFAVLILQPGNRVVTYNAEYGDNEGISRAIEARGDVRAMRDGLSADEKLEVRVLQLTHADLVDLMSIRTKRTIK